MKFTTRFELHSQTTRLFEDVTQGPGLPAAQGAVTLHGALFQGTPTGAKADDVSRTYNSDVGATSDFKIELFPLRSPLLWESLLVSPPGLIDMLKFSP